MKSLKKVMIIDPKEMVMCIQKKQDKEIINTL